MESVLGRPRRVLLGYNRSLALKAWMYVIAQSCPTLCDPTDCSLPGSSVHGDSPKILEWVAMPSSRESSQLRDRTQVSPIAGRFFTS